MIQIYDSYSKEYKEVKTRSINMYVCGITTSDYCHLGHAFSSVSFEILDRFLSSKGFNVNRIQNFTDVDDKIIAKSLEEKISADEVSEKYIDAFFQDMDELGVKRANHYPKATDEIDNIIEFIKKLEERNMTYSINGSIYFRVSKFDKYGKLSSRDIKNSLSGTRVNENLNKESVGDFALWKSSKPDEPSWDSPWGKGRPGWHLECSVMSKKFLGEKFDIHGGGLDLIFPHHENEIAQSRCANENETFANYWVHNNFITISSEKMSKSQGNILKISDFKNKVSGQVLRMALISAHYKQPLDWNDKLLSECEKTINKWYESYTDIKKKVLIPENFLAPLYDDLNTPGYIANLHKLFDKSQKGSVEDKEIFVSACNFIGLLNENKKSWDQFKQSKLMISEEEIQKKIKDRNNARENKDYKAADKIRNELSDKGVLIEDKGDKTLWKYK